MQLKVADRVIDKYNKVSVSLRYDSVASTFGLSVYFEPTNSTDRKLFVPGRYSVAQLMHGNEILITGVLLSQGTESEAKKQLMRIGGYSSTGVLEDCQNPVSNPVQFNGMSLAQIAAQLIAPYGISLIVEDIVSKECNEVYTSAQTFEADETVKNILSKIASQKNVVLSHDVLGNLILTRANTSKAPIYNFVDGQGGVFTSIKLTFDGQAMHSEITVVGQGVVGSDNAVQESVKNPYVATQGGGLDWMGNARNSTLGNPKIAYTTGNRPGVYIQTSGDSNDTKKTARWMLSQELKGIRLNIELCTWYLNGVFVRPNNIITVTSPENCLYQKSRWFIESVDYQGDEKSETCTLNCVLPECYNNDEVKNVFTGSNLTVAVADDEPKRFLVPDL